MKLLSGAIPTMFQISKPALKIFIAGLAVALTACSNLPPKEDSIVPKGVVATINTKEVMFIHGMFVSSSSWDLWRPEFEKAGYTVSAPAWPLHDVPMDRTKDAAHRTAMAQLGLEQVLNHYRAFLKPKAVKPILVGHSMGGLVAQKLLQEGLAQAAVVVDSAAPKGVLFVSWSFLKSQWPIISPFADNNAPLILTREEFAYSFTNQQTDAVTSAAYATVVPESRKVAKDTLTAIAAIDLTQSRGPLLMLAGENDHILPAALNYKNFELYRNTPGRTDFKLMAGRDHWLIAGTGWDEVAGVTLKWIKAQSGN